MAIVSISEAARLTGKSRNTLHAQIRTGKLSTVHNPVTNSKGIDTSELIRVFGSIKNTESTEGSPVQIEQTITSGSTVSTDQEKEILKRENKRLSDLLLAKQETIDSLNNAIRLLDYQRKETSKEETKEERKGFFNRFFR